MFKVHNLLCLIIYVCECILYAKSIPCRGSASYKLQFQAEWSNSTSGARRPDGAGFSGLIGCSHNKCYKMWTPGKRASLGVKNVAEKGDTRELEREIKSVMVNGTFHHFTQPTPLDPQKTALVATFTVNSVHPLVSVIGKITPSPDWFIGVRSLDLCDRKTGKWVSPTKQVTPVVPYDAGTDSSTQFTSSGRRPSDEDIYRITGGVLGPWANQKQGFGVFHFALQLSRGQETTGEFNSDETFECPNVASLRDVPCVVIFLATLLALLHFHT